MQSFFRSFPAFFGNKKRTKDKAQEDFRQKHGTVRADISRCELMFCKIIGQKIHR